MRSLSFLRPRRQDLEWIGGRYTLSRNVRENEGLIRPAVILWIELPRLVIVGSKMFDSREPVSFAQTLSEAMAHPHEGSARKPSRIRVADEELAGELRRMAFGIPVVVAEVPELDAVVADMERSFSEAMPTELSYLAGGSIAPEVVARLFSAASRFFRAAPWRHVTENQLIGVDIPALEIEGGCLCIVGGQGESFGLLLFRSLEALERYASQKPGPGGNDEELLLGDEPELLSISFDRKRDLPPAMRKEVDQHRWEVAGTKAFPIVMAVDENAVPHQAEEPDLRVLSACAAAFTEFLGHHRDLFAAADPESISESIKLEDGMIVTLTAPLYADDFEAPDDFDDDEFFPFEGEPLIEPQQAVGRNDPCPCGSGKKYKKCHLDSGRPSGPELQSQDEGIHGMDFRLVKAIGQFATHHFGRRWRGNIAEHLDGDEACVDLVAPWTAWTIAVDRKRVADHFLEQDGRQLSHRERAWFEAQRRSWLSVWEVSGVEPGMVAVRDLLTGEKRSVHEDKGSRILVPRDTLLTRVIDFEGTTLFGGMYARTLPPTDAFEVLTRIRSKLRAKKGDVALELLRDPLAGRFLIDYWREAVAGFDERLAIPPILQNTDGDPFLLVTDSFRFEQGMRAEIEKRLAAMDGVDAVHQREGETEIVYTKPGNRAHPGWKNTIVGMAVIMRDSLRIETNSERRADALRLRIRDACAGLLSDPTRTSEAPASISPGASAAASRGSRKPAGIDPAEEQAIIREMKEAHYRDWVDLPVPMLGGKTPRAAKRSARSRERLDLLLREIENSESRLPAAIRYDVSRLREELGLDPTK